MLTTAGADLLLVGRVIGTHGLQGELKIVSESDNPDRVAELERIWVGKESHCAVEYRVQRSRQHRTKHGLSLLIHLAEVRSKNDATAMCGLGVYAQAQDLPPLEPGEHFLHDLIGAAVVTESGAVVGDLMDIWSAPASDIYVVRRAGQRDALVPAVPTIVKSVDATAGRVVIEAIEGLLD